MAPEATNLAAAAATSCDTGSGVFVRAVSDTGDSSGDIRRDTGLCVRAVGDTGRSCCDTRRDAGSNDIVGVYIRRDAGNGAKPM